MNQSSPHPEPSSPQLKRLGARRAHHLKPLRGRNPLEFHRAATPLELLFDLTFVVAFVVAGNEFAHFVADGHFVGGLLGYALAIFAIVWAWINFSWFASAYDTDDWLYRLTTMVQMVGVIILALGLPELFDSIDAGGVLNNGVMVFGYVVMRVAMVAQWVRVSISDPERRPVANTYIAALVLAQIGWIAVLFAQLDLAQTLACVAVLIVIEMLGPVIAERYRGGTPWHAEHIVERYGLLVIITLGEGVIGTVASVSALVEHHGWVSEAILLAVAGIGITFALWWLYFMLPAAEILAVYRKRALVWGYAHMLVFASLAAVGAGLHVAAYYIEESSVIGPVGTILAVAIPLALFIGMLVVLYAYLVRVPDIFQTMTLAATLIILVLAVAMASWGVSMNWCLVVLMLAPVVPIIGFETVGFRNQERAVRTEIARASS